MRFNRIGQIRYFSGAYPASSIKEEWTILKGTRQASNNIISHEQNYVKIL